MSVHEVESTEEYNQLVSSHPLVVVDFGASWCGPCKKMAPIYHELAEKYHNICFIKVDVDEEDCEELKKGIRSLPTFRFIVKGNVAGADLLGSDENGLRQRVAQLAATSLE